MSEQSVWGDRKKWRMDLVKSAIAFTCVSAVTVSVLWSWDDNRLRANHVWQADHSLKQAAIQEFSRAARLYGLWSHDATKERMCGIERGKDNTIMKWEDEGYDNVKVARLSVKTAFPKAEIKALWDNFDAAQKDVRDNYREVRNKVSPAECKRGGEHKDAAWKAYNDAHFKPALTKYEVATDAIIEELLNQLRNRAQKGM